MPKFFVEPYKVSDDKIIIDTADVNHIKNVLRMEIGNNVTVCDSCGYDYDAKIISITPNEIVCSVITKSKSDTEPDISVVLYQGIPKGSKMEYIIQKTTELGIKKIVPVSMSRCVSKIENKKDAEKKVARWQKIAEAAAKQSGRGIVPEIAMPISFKDAVTELCNYDKSFAPYECEDSNSIKNEIHAIKGNMSIAFIIGPEGGYDMSEINSLKTNGISTVTLGKRILRTETAGEAVLAMLMYEADELK